MRHVLSGIAFASIALVVSAPSSASTMGEWRYVVPPPGAAHRSPAESPLLLSPEVPEGLELDMNVAGRDLSFAQLRYGDAGSVRIAVAIERRKDGDPILYVDADRNRMLGESERIEGKDGRWEMVLAVSSHDQPDGKPVPRRVSFRLSRTGLLLGYATLGYLEGEVEIEGHVRAARRVDADGNGFWTDERDRLWIDLDGDGRWSAFDEQFTFAPVLRWGGTRYALRSDRLGTSLSLEKIEGVGHVRFQLTDAKGAPRADVVSLRAVLVGKDGSAVGVEGHDVPVEAPVGEYRLGVVTVALEDPQKGEPWSFVFSEQGGDREVVWHPVARDAEVAFDPIGRLDFKPSLDVELDTVRAGDKLVVTPVLYTGDGLLINTCYRGTSSSHWGGGGTRARTLLVAPGGVVLDQSDSGFA